MTELTLGMTGSGDTGNSNVSADTNSSSVERFLQGKNSKDLLKIKSWARDQFTNIKASRAMIERRWYLNLCFYYGKQNVVFRQSPNLVTGVNNSLWVPPAPYWRSRPVINRIKPVIRAELAKLTGQKPSAYIVPASSEDHDLFAAQAGEQIWESIYRRQKLGSVIRQWAWWGLVCGNSFLKVCWDPDKTDQDSDQAGDFDFFAETPFHVFVPDFREPFIEDQPFVINAKVHSEDWAKIYYPNAKLTQSGDQDSQILDDTWLNIIGAQNLKGKKNVLCLEVWVKPGQISLFPNGAMFTVVGDDIVEGSEGWPYDHGQYPFAKFDHIPTGKFYCDSTIDDLIPLQREYNRTRGQIIEAKNRMAKPNLVAERGAVNPSEITTEPGQVIQYTPGFQPPQPLPMVNLPSYVLQELDRILLDINDISGQHEISKGQTPPGVTAATAINFLQEQDESMLSHTFASVEEGLEKVAFQTLSLAVQFWDTRRTIKVVGVDGSFDALAFKGSDLRGNTDIRVEAGSALPTSKAAKQAFIMDLMKMGFIDPATGLEVMEMGGIAKIYEAVQVDVRQAQRENLKMAALVDDDIAQFQQIQQVSQMVGDTTTPQLLVPVNSFDNHAVHIEIHNKYRKGQAFEQLDDSIKQQFEQHVQQHVMAVMAGQSGQNPTEVVKSNMGMGGPPPEAGPGNSANANTPDTSTPPVAGSATDFSSSNSSGGMQ